MPALLIPALALRVALLPNAHEFDAAARSPERRALLESICGKGMEGSDGSSGQQAAPMAMYTVLGSG
jgi:hypothetical protein